VPVLRLGHLGRVAGPALDVAQGVQAVVAQEVAVRVEQGRQRQSRDVVGDHVPADDVARDGTPLRGQDLMSQQQVFPLPVQREPAQVMADQPADRLDALAGQVHDG
jgi:hypothetical protein